MHIMQFLISILIFFLFPYLTGMLFSHRNNNKLLNSCGAFILLPFIYGFLTMLSVFQLLCVPMERKASFTQLTYIWLAVILILCAVSIILNRGLLFENIRDFIKKSKVLPWQFYIAAALIVLQMVTVLYYTHIDDDDSFFVATANTSVYTDTIMEYNAYTGEPYIDLPKRYALSPWPIFCALLANLTGVHPAEFMHAYFPPILILFAYMIYFLIGKALFDNNIKRISIFLIFLSILNLFGGSSVYTASSFFLLRLWQGKAALANIILPLIILFELYTRKYKRLKSLYIGLFLSVLCACAVSSTGIGIAPIMILIFALTFAIKDKSFKTLLKYALAAAPAIPYGIRYIFM